MNRVDPTTLAPLHDARYPSVIRQVAFRLLKENPEALLALADALRDEASKLFDVIYQASSPAARKWAQSGRRDVLDLLHEVEDAEALRLKHLDWDA